MGQETLCRLCDKNFDTNDKLDYHIKTFHQRLHVCDACPNFTTMIKFRLLKHLELEHSIIPIPVAPPAAKTSPEIEVIKEKLVLVPTQKLVQLVDEDGAPILVPPISTAPGSPIEAESLTTFECDLCWFTTRERDEITAHLVKQHGLEPEVAQHTAQVTSASDDLEGPASQLSIGLVVPENSKAFKSGKCEMRCSLCEYKTRSIDEIIDHVGKGYHFAPGKNPICPHCPFSPTSPKDLVDHGKSHFGAFVLYSFICAQCHFKSLTYEAIERHFQQGHNNKPA